MTDLKVVAYQYRSGTWTCTAKECQLVVNQRKMDRLFPTCEYDVIKYLYYEWPKGIVCSICGKGGNDDE